MGGTLRLRAFCTAKLSRRLYLCLLDFLKVALRDLESVKIFEAINTLLKRPTLPSGIVDSFMQVIQDIFGMYIFYDDTDLTLYIGKNIKLKSRILSHFSSHQKMLT